MNQILSDEQKVSRRSSTSSISSRTHSPSEQQQSFLSSSLFSTIVPSPLTHKFSNEMHPSLDNLCCQPGAYHNWLMLQQIVQNNPVIKQLRSTDYKQENVEDTNEIPLDLSMKVSTDESLTNTQTSIKHSKTTLLPLNDYDISKYNYIDTVELVQTIKELLNHYNISQRHFGENILGLSQGSVRYSFSCPIKAK